MTAQRNSRNRAFWCGVSPGLRRLTPVSVQMRPVVVLAGAVHAVERLFVQQADEAVARRDLFHDLHGELVVVGGDVRGGKDGRELVLRGGDLVVLGLGEHAELPQLLVQIGHELRDARLDRAEIMVVHLLSLRRHCAEERAPAEHKVLALIEHGAVHEEIFLLGADERTDASSHRPLPKSCSTRSACLLSACIERSSGVFLSSASPP